MMKVLQKARSKNRPRDFGEYFVICLVVIATIAGVASTGLAWNTLFKGIQFCIFPIVLLGLWIPRRPSKTKTKQFWLAVATALLVHSAGCFLVAKHYETFKPIYTALVAYLECAAFVVSRDMINRVPLERS